ncbi:gamma glutamyl phosphate reductase [Brachyspira pilosicoli B2904]|uniref:Gamma-glutamyl phosphate reductase n=2 Tax=Brachyspira pilosicoli TaxID=52584 RepID=A0AAJ6GI14_BRAPL|nr:glutamate-5-semialdehyde dehydrogenase [Brachyspira pilosicoli]AFR70708.1 gamma glutamyl phosphate reductase [Brachyspira pilosicoli B2904]WIH90850.1 glutamate-5-semialdehyde dehydrogenase [Brachyspira pilosicoli]WIH93141.1 glutamate-5-semialdehyde dehydrogenase [Brachyspira pilosicoli]WIH95430.1 glutamate-5-semialdehyde dehydrogenase [Brachyspira pilosicoli]
MQLIDLVKNAKDSTYKLQSLSTDIKNKALLEIADKLEQNKNIIFEANKKDLEYAKKLLDENKISLSMFNRLKLDENKMIDIISGIKDVVKLEDPINKVLLETELDDNLLLKKISCPIGLIAVIFEARPDVISQISSLCIKSSNAVILKGGAEGENTNKAIFNIINETLESIEDFPKNSVNLVFTRDDIKELLSMDKYVDLIIPRGGNSLVQYIKSNTNIPVLGHADGICHLYIDESANQEKALKICLDSKSQYPSACNAVETILINKNIANEYLPKLYNLFKENNIKMNGCEEVRKILNQSDIGEVKEWHLEYGDKEASLKIVENTEEAYNHINKYGSHHTDSIVSENKDNIEKFMTYVDSANVYANTSTRFSDGFRYGFGAEVGISTNKTHARGPVGLEGLTIYKYKLFGNYQIVDDYVSHRASFKHKRIK